MNDSTVGWVCRALGIRDPQGGTLALLRQLAGRHPRQALVREAVQLRTLWLDRGSEHKVGNRAGLLQDWVEHRGRYERLHPTRAQQRAREAGGGA